MKIMNYMQDFHYWVVFSQDVALLDKLIKDDRESGKIPLVLIANAGQFIGRSFICANFVVLLIVSLASNH